MACGSCGSGSSGGCSTGGCSSGGCATGGCNKMDTYDYLAINNVTDITPGDIYEISFKNGAYKSFYKNEKGIEVSTGDVVVVEDDGGYNIGQITLTGELVNLQIKKKNVRPKSIEYKIVRKANEKDLERLVSARSLEKQTMVRSRVIARTIGLNMKIGEVIFRADKKKATFFYIADGRVDFRELIKQFAREFKVKIEMKQIGSRQESAIIGGIGACGRELCCSTWLSDFKTVTTTAARYQNLSINQTKLSGQCGRLKCCINFELDAYLDALEDFPKNPDKLQTEAGLAYLIKTDIFKGILYYQYRDPAKRGKVYALDIERVNMILDLNRQGKKIDELVDRALLMAAALEAGPDYGDGEVTGVIELPDEAKRKKRRNNRNNKNKNRRKPNAGEKGGKKPQGAKGGAGQAQTAKKPRNNNQKGKPAANANQKGKGTNPNQNKQGSPKGKGPQNKKTNPNQKGKAPQNKGTNPNQNKGKGPQNKRPTLIKKETRLNKITIKTRRNKTSLKVIQNHKTTKIKRTINRLKKKIKHDIRFNNNRIRTWWIRSSDSRWSNGHESSPHRKIQYFRWHLS